MKGLLLTVRRRFDAMERRDQKALLGLILFFLLLFLYFGVWSPASSFAESRQADRDQQLALVQFMRSSESAARAVGAGSAPAPTGQALLSQISRTAQKFNISPNRLQPEGIDGVSVWFDGVAFNDLIRWLEAEAKEGIAVRQISIDRHAESGLVNARVVLRN